MVAGPFAALADRVGARLAGAEINQPELGIDGGCLPDIGAAIEKSVRFVRIGIGRRRPRVAAAFARTRRRPEMPQLLAGLRVERGEFAARGAIAAGDTGIDRALVIGRRGGDGVAVLPFADCRLPEELPGLGIQRDEGAVELAEKDLSLAERDAAIVP